LSTVSGSGFASSVHRQVDKAVLVRDSEEAGTQLGPAHDRRSSEVLRKGNQSRGTTKRAAQDSEKNGLGFRLRGRPRGRLINQQDVSRSQFRQCKPRHVVKQARRRSPRVSHVTFWFCCGISSPTTLRSSPVSAHFHALLGNGRAFLWVPKMKLPKQFGTDIFVRPIPHQAPTV